MAQQEGFRRKKTYLLEWPEGHEYHGLQIRTRPVALGAMLEIVERSDDDKTALRELFQRFADVLVWWNLEDDNGAPIPATFEGMETADVDMLTDVIKAWQTLVVGVSGPKEQPSSAGSQSVEGLIPMDTLSESQVS